ncbi:MAG: hypothetical protein FWF80_02690 [Defluviitaleaceae bacterium]|nr:hypothetical protein [Defluviitaleaceae bacterium]
MLTDTVLRGWDELEAAAEKAGGYLVPPRRPVIMDYDYRAMSKYATQKGVTSMELTDKERDMFKFDPPLVYD